MGIDDKFSVVPSEWDSLKTEIDYTSLQYLTRNIYEEMVQAEIKVIKEVLRMILKRVPVEQDFKKVACVYNGSEREKYTLTFDGIALGVVERNFNTGLSNKTLLVQFIPTDGAFNNNNSWLMSNGLKISKEIRVDADRLLDSFDNFIYQCRKKMNQIDVEEKYCIIMMPKHLMGMLNVSIVRKYQFQQNLLLTDGGRYMEFKVSIGYENKFVCFYENFPALQDERFYLEAPLPTTT